MPRKVALFIVKEVSKDTKMSPRPQVIGKRGANLIQTRWRWPLRIFLAVIIAMIFTYLPYRVFSPRGERIQEMENELSDLELKAAMLRGENHRFQMEIEALKKSPQTIADIARDELGLIFSNEVVIRIDDRNEEKTHGEKRIKERKTKTKKKPRRGGRR